MYEIKIPESIKIGGFDYTIEISVERDKVLDEDGFNGEHSEKARRISVTSTLAPQDFSKVFMHEVIHGINSVYCCRRISEDMVQELSQGYLQVMEQLGIRFVQGEKK
jgi:hypothetical protein